MAEELVEIVDGAATVVAEIENEILGFGGCFLDEIRGAALAISGGEGVDLEDGGLIVNPCQGVDLGSGELFARDDDVAFCAIGVPMCRPMPQ